MNLKIKDGDKEQKEEIQENNRKHTDFIIKKTSDGDIELLVGVNYNTVISKLKKLQHKNTVGGGLHRFVLSFGIYLTLCIFNISS